MTGLSILIPVFNRNVTALVQALLAQVPDWGGPVEILLFDDASAKEFRQLNRPLGKLAGVRYQQLPRNVGRAAIRNQLAAAAQHPWLLLLDNNISLPDASFLARYSDAASQDQGLVLVGGTIYTPAPPADPACLLRWHYGNHREARPAPVRQQKAYAQFTLKNVLVWADIFRKIGLDESLTRYGHEDTKFGWQLREAGIPIHHLPNPVLHDGLEPAAEFLEKTHEAVRNLALLYRAEGLGSDTKLLKAALQLHRWGLGEAVRVAFQLRQDQVRRNLLSVTPSLRQLDALKLYWMLTELGKQA
ncbi:glycosyltransferase [Hymenobacter tibetensis]|uniref:Glycosyltransferase n=1 Tax=Hymenobacter tibetensis TaxID=497967 RepID=A0ABY4D585_9BACT|nr:glycosyltransferase [Hymenobacter tibetensis]UOG76725.1 glycosyltransferase [Hymenobacter tibetensis]